MKFLYILTRIVKIKKTDNIQFWLRIWSNQTHTMIVEILSETHCLAVSSCSGTHTYGTNQQSYSDLFHKDVKILVHLTISVYSQQHYS